MNASLFIILNLVAIVVGSLLLRLWLRRQPDPQGTHRRICGAIMWLGCLICVAALVLELVCKPSHPQWLLTSTGGLIVVSMLLARRGTAPKPGDKH